MRTTRSWLVLLLMVGMAATPAAALGQQYGEPYAPPDPVFPVPLFSNRPDEGGLYFAGEFLFMRQTNPLEHQMIAKRGLFDVDGSINGIPGAFLGSGRAALFADDVGQETYQPGFDFTLGWKFRGGVALEFSWWHLSTAEYVAGATLLPGDFSAGFFGQESFLTAPVFNVPHDFSGPFDKLPQGPPPIPKIGNPFAVFGIWNGASEMQLIFTQRFDQYDITARIPIFQTERWRTYGIIGPRLAWQWERFKWRTVDLSFNGTSSPEDVGIYTNVVSNRMYGVHIGAGNEWATGDTPMGTFAISLDLQAAPLVDFVKETVKYERGDHFSAAKKATRDATFVPEVEAQINVWWYPVEGVVLRAGYNIMAFFDTIASPNPVSFNFSGLDPAFEHEARFLDGINAGIGFIF